MKTYARRRRGSGAEAAEVVNLDEVCRLCLAREEREDRRVPIFTQEDPVPLALRIMACVALEMVEDDGLPATICRPCHYQIEKYYVFRKKCESSNLKLRMHLKQLGEVGGGVPSEEDDKLENLDRAANEQEIVGASVTIVIPEEGEGEMEIDGHINEVEEENDITLPQDDPEDPRQACTLKQEMLAEEYKEEERPSNTESAETRDIEVDVVINEQEAAEVIETIAVDPLKDVTDEALSVRVLPSTKGIPTHVEVTTGDGSILLMELTTEEPSSQRNEAGELLVFECEQCPKAFSRMIDLKRHMSVHAIQRGVTCPVCEKWFPSQSSFARHERIHTGEKPFQCGVCERKFVQKEVLLRHMLVHSEVKPYNCNTCKKGFTQRETLRVHNLRHQNVRRGVRVHNCPLCPKVFCHASGLSRHLVVHSGRLYKCLDCDRLFNDKSSLRRHHRVSGHQSTV